MKLAEFFEKYNLHDSIIEDLKYIPGEMKLVINLELCNWKQSFYESTEPEMKVGSLVFWGIAYFQAEPKTLSIDSNEILDVSLFPSKDAVKIIFTNCNDVGTIEVKAESVSWEKEIE